MDNLEKLDELIVEKKNEGVGPVVPVGSTVTVHYEGKIASTGKVFDSSY